MTPAARKHEIAAIKADLNDFGIQVNGTDEWDYSQGAPRKYYHGTGSHLGGKKRIKIETINGNINIRRAG